MTVAGPIFVISTSACGVMVSASVLFAELGSDAPDGGVTLAVLTSRPVAVADTVPVAVNVTDPPTGTLTLALMLPAPEGSVQTPPPAPMQVQVTPVSAAGKLSITVAPIASLGPAFVTVIS